MRTRSKSYILLVSLMVSISAFGVGWAATDFYNFSVSGDVEFGWLFFADRPPEKERGYLEQYRDMSPGPFGAFQLYALSKDESYLFEALGEHAGREDQNILVRSSKIGVYTFEFEWDQIPHVYSTRSRLDDEISLQRDTARFALGYTPAPDWDLFVEYRYTEKSGERPRGVAEEPFQVPESISEFEPFLEPIKYKEQDGTVAATYAKKGYQVSLSYNVSSFNNDTLSIRAPGEDGSARDRISLPPDNMAHIVSLAGGVSMPYKTRVNGLLSYGLNLQDEDLLPPVSSSPATSAPTDFDGEVNTLLLYLSGTSRPLPQLTVKAKYRLYHYGDDSDFTVDEDEGEEDAFLLLAERMPYTKQNVGLEGKWQFQWPMSLILSYNYEGYLRDDDPYRADTNDHTPRIALNYTPLSWLLIGTSYSHSIRTSDQSLETFQGRVPPPTPPHSPQTINCSECHGPGSGAPFPLLSKFNMADRNRDRFDFFTEFTPWNSVTFTTNFGLAQDDYNYDIGDYGLLDDDSWFAGADFVWTPFKRLALSANYLHEEFDTRQRVDDDLEIDFDPGPILKTDDRIDTVGAGANISLLPEKLDLDMRYSLSYATSDFHNPLLPDLEEVFSQYKTYLRYRITGHWTAKLGYIFEDFNVSNEYTRESEEFPTSYYYSDYTAHMIALSMLYRF